MSGGRVQRDNLERIRLIEVRKALANQKPTSDQIAELKELGYDGEIGPPLNALFADELIALLQARRHGG